MFRVCSNTGVIELMKIKSISICCLYCKHQYKPLNDTNSYQFNSIQMFYCSHLQLNHNDNVRSIQQKQKNEIG